MNCYFSNAALAVLLIEAGADVNLKDKVSPEHAWILFALCDHTRKAAEFYCIA